MRSVLAVIAIILSLILLSMLILLGFGIGAGYLVHWLFPAIDLGAAVVAGVVAASVTSYYLLRFFIAAFGPFSGPRIWTGESDEDDSDRSDLYVLDPLGTTRTGRQKSTRRKRQPPASP